MTSRNKKEANNEVFKLLDEFCSKRGDPIANAGAIRWIDSSDGFDERFLRKSTLYSAFSFGSSIKLGRFDLDGNSIFCAVGFDPADEISQLVDHPLTGGILTAILYELRPTPAKSSAEIRDIVEYSSKEVEGYGGHDAEDIAKLFPYIQCFTVEDVALEETSRVFFLICLAQSERSRGWMDRRLCETLELVAELSPIAIPYRTLCRSLLDVDPGSVFLALYRCLEALYAYSHTQNLIQRLEIDKEWSLVAQDLEDTLGWRPREEPSLEALLKEAVTNDLDAMIKALKYDLPSEANIVGFTTKKIYQLRNALVHYRPFHQSFDGESVDWNRLCEAMAATVLDVYSAVGPE